VDPARQFMVRERAANGQAIDRAHIDPLQVRMRSNQSAGFSITLLFRFVRFQDCDDFPAFAVFRETSAKSFALQEVLFRG
jgi:hypothetical protein